MSGKQCQSCSPGLMRRERFGRNDTKCVMTLSVQCRIWKAPGFSLDLLDVEGICPPIWGTKYNGGTQTLWGT